MNAQTSNPGKSTRRARRRFAIAMTIPMLVGVLGSPTVGAQQQVTFDEYRSLDGSGNNTDEPTLGAAGTIYPRVADANYADNVGELGAAPPPRYLSNRIFNDTNQNIFSENGVTHWGFVWGQFLDHTFGLRESGDEDLTVAFDPVDPLESFTNDLGVIATTRSAVAAGTGQDSPESRQTR